MVARAPTLAKSVEHVRVLFETWFGTVALGGAVALLLVNYGSVAQAMPARNSGANAVYLSADRRLEQASEFRDRECTPSGRDRACRKIGTHGARDLRAARRRWRPHDWRICSTTHCGDCNRSANSLAHRCFKLRELCVTPPPSPADKLFAQTLLVMAAGPGLARLHRAAVCRSCDVPRYRHAQRRH